MENDDINVTSIVLFNNQIKARSLSSVKSEKLVILEVLARSVVASAQDIINSEWATDVFGLGGLWLDVTVLNKKQWQMEQKEEQNDGRNNAYTSDASTSVKKSTKTLHNLFITTTTTTAFFVALVLVLC